LKRPPFTACRSSLSPSAAARHAYSAVIWELSARTGQDIDAKNVLSLIYVAVFPPRGLSVLQSGVQLIGANRAPVLSRRAGCRFGDGDVFLGEHPQLSFHRLRAGADGRLRGVRRQTPKRDGIRLIAIAL